VGSPCVIGSVKTNVGHLEAGAGIASLIKVALALDHGRIPKHLHYRSPNPAIDPEAMKLRIPTVTEPWPGVPGRRIAGVNGFGYGGANAHVLVSDLPPSAMRSADRNGAAGSPGDATPVILPFSARSPAALEATIRNVARWLGRLPADASPVEIASAAAHHRDHFPYRVAVVGTSVDEWRDRLGELEGSAHVGDAASPDDSTGEPRQRPVMFVFGGQGPQWWGMGIPLIAGRSTAATASSASTWAGP
jgi:acyl transferase domain-containing protein